jgi:quinol monooxygenase YgiN
MSVDRGFLVTLEAKPGKGDELAAFLTQALPLAEAESGTVSWYAFKLSDTTYGIFDSFADEEGREAHFNGAIAVALSQVGPDLLARRPDVQRPSIIAAKGAPREIIRS